MIIKRFFLFITITIFTIAITNAQVKTKKMPRPTMAMDNSAVDAILSAMKNQMGDDGKLQVFQRFMKNNTDGIMVDQELRLLNPFATDDAKLECAKFAYPWSVDYKNYNKVQYNMGTAAAQKSLGDYIKKQGKN